MIAVGVDPGIHGAVALVDTTRQRLLECANLPTRSTGSKGRIKSMIDANALARLLDGWGDRYGEPGRAAVEKMQPFMGGGDKPEDRPASSPVTLLSMGHTAGLVEGVLWCLFGEVKGFDVLRPLPQQWKRTYSLKSDKSASVLLARRMFRDLPARFRHDLAEAALLAHWAGGAMPALIVPQPGRRAAAQEECAFP